MTSRLLVVLTALSFAACGGGAAAGAFDPAAMPRGGDWTGIYFSDWGRMELQRTGDTVVGTFRSDVKHGRLSGSVNGNVLRFSWTQLDERIGGRTREIEGSGQFRYVVDDNGEHHLEGTWGYGPNISGAGIWNAAKSRTRPRPAQPTNAGGDTGDTGDTGTGDTGDTGTGDTDNTEQQQGQDALDNL